MRHTPLCRRVHQKTGKRHPKGTNKMNQITQWDPDLILEVQLTLALADQLGSIELAAKVAHIGMMEIASIRCQASDKVATTLATANELVQAATYTGRVTPALELELRQRTQVYLQEM